MPHSTSPKPGKRFTSDSIAFSEADIIAFAQVFDPQPYHLDRAAGDASIFGGLCASGWQVAALANRLLSEALLDAGIDFVEVTRVEHMRWKKPLFVDDAIRIEAEVVAVNEPSFIPGCRDIGLTVQVKGSDDSLVAEMSCSAAVEGAGGSAS